MFTIRPGGGAKTFARFLKKKMKKERVNIGLEWIQLNEGQLPWLPKNPRTWTQTDIDKTAASIKQDPDFLEDRPLLVVSREDSPNLVVFAGNLRSVGARAARLSRVPCVLYSPEEDEDYETIRRRAMKDNGSFGSWDFDALANEWDDLPLTDWGVPAWETPKEDNTDKMDLSDQLGYEFKLEITCVNESEQKAMYDELIGRGYECRILTL